MSDYTGFSFHIDRGNHPPICFKPPRCGSHDSEFMINLVERLDEDGLLEEYDVP